MFEKSDKNHSIPAYLIFSVYIYRHPLDAGVSFN